MHPINLQGIMSTLYLSPKTQHFSWIFHLEKWKLVHIKTCTQIFVLALLIITKNWKQYKFPLTSESMNKLWYNHARYTSKHKVTIYDMYQNLDKSQWYYAESLKRLYTLWFHLWHSPNVKLQWWRTNQWLARLEVGGLDVIIKW